MSHNPFYFTLNFLSWVLSRRNSIAEEKAYYLIKIYGKTKYNS